ncbi:MAG: hypothetical protein J6A95_04400 [Clostridia bacterium]|nr:hypothetical protein [Clostridia bacterium]
MKYENPTYKIELLESKDVVTLSFFVNGLKFKELFENDVEVSLDANDLFE